jgi:hypothetical protein
VDTTRTPRRAVVFLRRLFWLIYAPVECTRLDILPLPRISQLVAAPVFAAGLDESVVTNSLDRSIMQVPHQARNKD